MKYLGDEHDEAVQKKLKEVEGKTDGQSSLIKLLYVKRD